MSKEALIGFATYAIRISSTTEDNQAFHLHVDPLNNPFGNQTFGFFLTNDSPGFVLMYNQAKKLVNNQKFIFKERKDQFKYNYRIPLYTNDNEYEPFEIAFENIAKISVIDKNGRDVTQNCISVVLKINKNELYNFGEFIIKIAHNYKHGNKYRVCSSRDNNKNIYNSGFLLDDKSSKLTIECFNLGNVFSYEADFGKSRK